MHEKVSVIIGPTSIGKSEYALNLARQQKAEIISADAFQVYKYMDIGTAKVSQNARQEIPHHLIDIIEPDQPYSVAHFMAQSEQIIGTLQSQKKKIIICGGTGFFIKSFLYRYQFSPHSQDKEFRKSLEERALVNGPGSLWAELKAVDPVSAERISQNDTQRVIRALELFQQSGEKPSDLRGNHTVQRDDVDIIGLNTERPKLIEKINRRVDHMMKQGLIDEVESLMKQFPKECLAFQGLGYKECILFLSGSLSKQEMVELIKLRTRQFAKRQMTWFRRVNNVHWHNII